MKTTRSKLTLGRAFEIEGLDGEEAVKFFDALNRVGNSYGDFKDLPPEKIEAGKRAFARLRETASRWN